MQDNDALRQEFAESQKTNHDLRPELAESQRANQELPVRDELTGSQERIARIESSVQNMEWQVAEIQESLGNVCGGASSNL